MSTGRAVLILLAASLACAGAVAMASRAPASLRLARPGPEASDPSLGAGFTDEQIARHGAYRGPGYLGFALSTGLEVATLVVLALGPFRRGVEFVQRVPGGWPARAALLATGLAVVLALVGLPLGFVRGYVVEHAWDLSTQDFGGWLGDRARALGIAAVTSAISAVAFFGVVRAAPRTWWLWGATAFTLLTALLVFLWPVVIAPIFNRFTPVEDRALAGRIRSLAAEAGVAVDEVLVADASRRTTTENAYVAGLGATKRVVLYDTLLENSSQPATMFVVAHELGHEAESHVLKGTGLAAIGLFASFGVLALLAERGWFWSWAGASGPRDLRALPLLVLFATVATLITTPLASTISRRFEGHADRIALKLTEDPETAVESFRRLAFANLSDLRPPRPLVWALFSHPPIADRLRSALAHSASAP